ncbi:MAG: T9SS type A sorting domain-containing protein [Melioribacteraceae bacterium]|nr:T9SS type A sorting domain-containing protein [Melioribacteraceae bacterium]MCF8354550.1 T9SS type A sorting domain-containing protein [Melioribacteraceae bacterium]MCF8394482.1 T9SS type A sorting domain-containing protein [Melioribacteraceae bacterium]MCF8420108.1 T9SS type A sorting domain-containing protein [Melioribacteraceae bacterium]
MKQIIKLFFQTFSSKFQLLFMMNLFLFFFILINSNIYSQTVSLSADPSVSETAGTATITATANPAPADGVTITVTISDAIAPGTAVGSDYTLSSTSILIVGDAGGNSTGTATIDVAGAGKNDGNFEGTESVVIDITAVSDDGGVGYTENGAQQVSINILDDETISISRDNAVIAEDGVSTVTYTASVDGGGDVVNGDLTVTMLFTGSATSGTDFTGAGNITINNNSNSGTVILTSTSDGDFEGDETITGEITALDYGAGQLGTTSASSTITDDETISISRDNAVIAEDGVSTVTYTASVDGGGDVVNGDLTVTMLFTGSATSGTDFTGAGNITITNSTTSGTVLLTSTADSELEGDETINGEIAGLNYGAGQIGTSTASTTITDDEQASLVSPADGGTVLTLAPTLTWNDMPGADQYILEVYVDNSGNPGASVYTNNTVVDAGAGTQSLTLNDPDSPILDNTTYHWRVAGKNTSVPVNSAYSGYYTFTTDQQTITIPANGAYNVLMTPNASDFDVNFVWDAIAGATDYNLSVGTSTGSYGFANTTVSGTSTTLTDAFVYNTAYYWVVQSENGGPAPLKNDGGDDAIETSTEYSFTTLLATPVLTAPIGGTQVSSLSPTFTWTMEGNTSNVTYTLHYKEVGAGSYTDVTGISSTSYSSLTLNSARHYEWYVTADDGPGMNDPKSSSVEDFYTPLQLLTPVNTLTGVAIEPLLTWEDANWEATYQLEISTNSTFTGVVLDTTLAADTDQIQLDEFMAGVPLQNNTWYWWRVTADDGVSYTQTSPEWSFKTLPQVVVTPSHPTAGTTVYTTTTLFSWYTSQLNNGLDFNIQVTSSTSGGNPDWSVAPDFQTTTSNTNATFTLLKGKTYYWRVIVKRTSNSEVLSYSPVTQFQTEAAAVTPIPSWPVGGALTYTNTPTFYWYLMSGSTGLEYTLQISLDQTWDGDGVNGDIEVSGLTSLYHTLTTSLDPGTVYYWRIYSTYIAGGTDSAPSAWFSFETNGAGTLVKPTISYPGAATTVYTESPYVYWYYGTAVSGIEARVKVYNVTDNSTTNTGLTTNNYVQLSLEGGKTYQVTVEVTNDAGSTYPTAYNSTTVEFTVAGGLGAGYPTASWPTGGPTIYTKLPTLSWYVMGSRLGITNYKVAWSTSDLNAAGWEAISDADFYHTTSDNNTLSYTLSGTEELNYGQTYYWAVAAYDGSGYSSWSEGTFTVVGESGSIIPVVSTPTGGTEITNTTTTLYWYVNGSTSGIVSYEVEWSATTVWNTTAPYGGSATTANQSYQVTDLIAGASYQWRVRSYNGTDYSSWSNPIGEFTVKAGSAPVMALPGSPANGIQLTTPNTTISWILPTLSDSPLSYELEISDNAEMTDASVIDDINSPLFSIDDLEPNKEYFWRVRSKNSEGDYSFYSQTTSFNTADELTAIEEKVEDAIPTEYSLDQNYPNPFNPTTQLRFAIPDAGLVSLKIYNMLGQEVTTLISGYKEVGTYNVAWNGTDNFGNKVTSGVYIYRITAGDFVQTKKMILLK